MLTIQSRGGAFVNKKHSKEISVFSREKAAPFLKKKIKH